MCGGRPFCSASVVKILLMSWGVKVSGPPVLAMRPCRRRGVLDAPFYVVAAEWPVLCSGAVLEQQR